MLQIQICHASDYRQKLRDYPEALYYDAWMRENYTLTRLYVDKPLRQGADVDLSREQAHYLGNVLRMGTGTGLRVFNGQDGEWRAEIMDMTKRGATLNIIRPLRPPTTVPDIWLCFAPVRKHRNAFIMEKATELGVACLQPVITRRTQFGKINLSKMQAQIIEAAEQTERLCLPELRETMSLERMLEGWDANRILILGDEAGDCPPVSEVMSSFAGPAAIFVGPEGGFDPKEREMLRDKSFVRPVSLGPRILRADTAALSMLTLWQSAQGDWR